MNERALKKVLILYFIMDLVCSIPNNKYMHT